MSALTRPAPEAGDDRLDGEVSARVQAVREAVESARAMPMSSSVVVNKAELLHLLDDVEQACRASVSSAHSLVDRRAELVATGRDEAEQLVRAATLERDRLVSDTEVFRVATREADEIRLEAREESAALLRDTDAWVATRFAAFEEALDSTLESLRRGRERLENGRPAEPGSRLSDDTAPMAALADDGDVAAIRLPEHLEA